MRCRKWVQVVGKEDLIYVPIEKLHTLKYVCGSHFNNKDFNKNNNRLRKSAIPSKNLKADPLPDEMLLEFPCHVVINNDYTNDNIFQEKCYKEVSPFHVEVIAVPGNSNLSITTAQPQLVDHNYCITNKEALSPKRTKISGLKETVPEPKKFSEQEPNQAVPVLTGNFFITIFLFLYSI
ncbi:hypothetical protein O3G_MSEX000074 [Manduca sexta]|nr:hypothetical protein O3G_MSEX000074 [Manduca sexta]